ncbi:unnamed protein product [Trifolium pratense]|uniref:Uncharacterized protein n=1 Tax=Trifolium pratense TaxID=57577 RepID=A0ACB0LI42_TRIPR|nr:unnamed protein product [Trifolium pratense]
MLHRLPRNLQNVQTWLQDGIARDTHTHTKYIVHWRISSGSTYAAIGNHLGSAVRNDWDHKGKAISTELNFLVKGVTIDENYDEGWRIWSWNLILLQKPML